MEFATKNPDVIFDFDGTLICGAGYAPGWIRAHIERYGSGLTKNEMERVLSTCRSDFEIFSMLSISGDAESFLREILCKNLLGLDRGHWDTNTRFVLEGIALNHRIFLLSNRDQAGLEEGVRRIGCDGLFTEVIGTSEELPGKPSGQMVDRLLSSTGPDRPRIYVGDKISDLEFSKRICAHFIEACWYKSESFGDLTCFEICDLPDLIESLHTVGNAVR